MAHSANRSWTLVGLICAFLDLVLAYFLLCVSAFAFFTSRFLRVFGLSMPCPCTGLLGYRNSNICLHRLLIDWPIIIIRSTQDLAKHRFPFDLVCFKDQEGHSSLKLLTNRKCEHGSLGLDNETCSSSVSGSRLQNLTDKESGLDLKGKKIVNQKQRAAIRRRKRAALGHGKSSPVLLCDNMQPVVAGVSTSPNRSYEIRSQISESLVPVSEMDDGPQDNKNAATGTDLGDRTWNNFELDGSCGETKLGTVGNEANVIRMLKQALEEEKAARTALYLELEKERAAAATAADEAMAMILRLQEDKASLEMEARQYERMIEEKFAYDEEEMDIMKEILVRRERENHFLEKELTAYREMNVLGIETSEVESNYMINQLGSSEHLPLVPQQIAKSKEVGSWSPNYEASSAGKQSLTHASENEILPRNKGMDPSLSTSQAVVPILEISTDSYEISSLSQLEKTANFDGKRMGKGDDTNVSQGLTMKTAQTSDAIEKKNSHHEDNLEKDAKHRIQVGTDKCSSMLEEEPIVYDVHVIDDKTELPKKENGTEGGRLNFAASGFGVWSDESLSETEPDIDRSSLNMAGVAEDRTPLFDSERNSSSVDRERMKMESEVEWLRERLRMVQEGKEQLTSSAEQRERVSAQLKLMEEIMNQLREIQVLREPVQQASLPSSSKVNLSTS